MRYALSPGLYKQSRAEREGHHYRTCTCTGELTAAKNLCKQRKEPFKERKRTKAFSDRGGGGYTRCGFFINASLKPHVFIYRGIVRGL